MIYSSVPLLGIKSTSPIPLELTTTTNPHDKVATLIADISNENTTTKTILTKTATTTTLTTTITKTAINGKERPLLHRQQDYSHFDSSEAQSDDSHLTRGSITIESQNDELSSSTLDKIDISALPLPELPQKKRRNRHRASPNNNYLKNRQRNNTTEHAIEDQELKASTIETTITSTTTAAETTTTTADKEEETTTTTTTNTILSDYQQYIAKRRDSLKASSRNFLEKLKTRNMHFHIGGGGGGVGGGGGGVGAVGGCGISPNTNNSGNIRMPTYLYGEPCHSSRSRLCRVLGSQQSPTSPLSPTMPRKGGEIYLNKSGWVQVKSGKKNDNRSFERNHTKLYHHNDGDYCNEHNNPVRVIHMDNAHNTRTKMLPYQELLYASKDYTDLPKTSTSHSRNYLPRGNKISMQELLNVANQRTTADPNIFNERPGFLPVRKPHDAESPPPITPILSPPPAFQDSAKAKHFSRARLIQLQQQQQQHHHHQQHQQQQKAQFTPITSILMNKSNRPGMVFSRSFEYGSRHNTPTENYTDTFSRSFDGDLSAQCYLPHERSVAAIKYGAQQVLNNSCNYNVKVDSKSPSSASIVNVSTETRQSRDNSPKYQQQTTPYLNTAIRDAPVLLSTTPINQINTNKYSPRTHSKRLFERSKSQNVADRAGSRKAQFHRAGSTNFQGNTRKYPQLMATSMSRFKSLDTANSQRLNSCDSGARSDLSNDELDNDDDDDNGSMEFLRVNFQPASPYKSHRQHARQHTTNSGILKQRSLTPESCASTPEERQQKGSQCSLMREPLSTASSRQNTLERMQLFEDKGTSMSQTSTSSSSEDDIDTLLLKNTNSTTITTAARRPIGRNSTQQANDEHRIRRSKYK